MNTHRLVIIALLGGLAALSGCDRGTSGGPGATSPPTIDRMGQSDNTFSMIIPNVALNQGEAKTIAIGIKRGKNFTEDVSLAFAALPPGLTIVSGDSVITPGVKDVKVAFKAANDAALGDFTIEVTGKPAKGADAKAEMKLSITALDALDTANASADAARAKWDEYTLTMQNQWDQFKEKFAALQESAAKAEGQVKVDLDAKLAEAKVKMDAAAVKLEELKTASADRWEKVKEGLANAFDDLKTIFE